MHPLHLRLADGSPGVLGAAPTVAAEIADDPAALAVVVDGLDHPIEGVRNRSAWVLDWVSRRYPGRLAPHANALLDATEAGGSGGTLRRLLPLILSTVPLDAQQARRVMTWEDARLSHIPVAETANILEALASIAVRHQDLASDITPHLDASLDHHAPSVRARARQLLARLDRHGATDASGP